MSTTNSTGKRRSSLGRGLDSLFADDSPAGGGGEGATEGGTSGPRFTVAIEALEANPFQPRAGFDDDELDGLAASIREQGILSPILVRPHPEEDGRYQIIAGERRWRAAQRAQIHDVPVIVRSLNDADTAQLAILENVQRQDLTALEEARGYRRLIDDFGYTRDGLGRTLGKSRSHIANTLRLLELPDAVLQRLQEGELSAGHGRALLGHPDPIAAADHVVASGLNVRQTEQFVRDSVAVPSVAGDADTPDEPDGRAAGAATSDKAPTGRSKDADTLALESSLTSHLGLKVVVDSEKGDGPGRVVIHYRSLEQLDHVVQKLTR